MTATYRTLERTALTREASAALDLARILTGLTETDVVNRALQFYARLEQEKADGKRVVLHEPDGTLKVLDWSDPDQSGTVRNTPERP